MIGIVRRGGDGRDRRARQRERCVGARGGELGEQMVEGVRRGVALGERRSVHAEDLAGRGHHRGVLVGRGDTGARSEPSFLPERLLTKRSAICQVLVNGLSKK